ncbi:unnamed protein product [Arctogadus glacialis]
MMNSTRPSLTLSQGPSQTPLCVTPCRQTPAERVPGQRYGFAPAGLPSLQQPGWEAKAGPGRVISLLETQTLQNGVQSSSQEAGESQTDSCPTPDMTLPFPTVAPCSDSPRAQSRNTPLADGIIIASKRADSRGPSPGSGGPCVIACETDRRVSVGEVEKNEME